MGPNNETKKANRSHGINHTVVTKDFFFKRITEDNMRNDTKAWKNKNVYFWMTKESKEMLI
jgi:hypothetical protein